MMAFWDHNVTQLTTAFYRAFEYAVEHDRKQCQQVFCKLMSIIRMYLLNINLVKKILEFYLNTKYKYIKIKSEKYLKYFWEKEAYLPIQEQMEIFYKYLYRYYF